MTRSWFYGTIELSRNITEDEAVQVNKLLDDAEVAIPDSSYIEFYDYEGNPEDVIKKLQILIDYLSEAGVTMAGELEYQGMYDGSNGFLVIADGIARIKSAIEDYSDEELLEELEARHRIKNVNELMIVIKAGGYFYFKTARLSAKEAMNEFLSKMCAAGINYDNVNFSEAVLRDKTYHDIDKVNY